MTISLPNALMRALPLLAVCATTGCVISGGGGGDLTYRQSAVETVAPVMGPPQIAGVEVADHRRQDADRLGTVLGFYGQPMGILDTNMPVKDEVASVVGEALTLHYLLNPSPAAPYLVHIDLNKFDADRYVRAQANIDMVVTLVDRRVGRPIYQQRFTDKDVEFDAGGSVLLYQSPSPQPLREMCEKLLSRTVDRLLTDPTFVEAASAPAR